MDIYPCLLYTSDRDGHAVAAGDLRRDGQPQPRALVRGVAGVVEAVSYTHLDVYKRQVENSEHIDAQRAKKNVYWDCYRGFTTPELRENPEQPVFSFEEIERMYYYAHYSDHVDAQNARNEKTRRCV